jgi:hypothetical protein
MLNIVSAWLPWVGLIIVAVGIVCITYGGLKWYALQKEFDEQTRLDTVRKRIDAQQLTTPEIVERVIDEVNESNEPNESNESNNFTYIDSRANAIKEAFRVEELYFNFLSKQLSQNYDVKNNLRIGRNEYDIVAMSKNTKNDLLFELKYWKNPRASQIISRVLNQVEQAGNNYKEISRRNIMFKLVIISDKETLPAVITSCKTYLDKLGSDLPPFIEVEFHSVNEIS